MSLFVTTYKNRTFDFVVTITDAAGVLVVFQAADVMRIKIGRLGEVPILDLDSVAPTSLTTVEAANPSAVHLHQDEADLLDAGIYSIEAAIVDTSDSNSIRHADQGVFQLLPTQLGDLAAT